MKMDHKPRPLGPFGCFLYATAGFGAGERNAVFRAFREDEGMNYTPLTPFEGGCPTGGVESTQFHKVE